jgi:hypothetical protein
MKQASHVLGTLLLLAGVASAEGLVLGSVPIVVGAPAAPTIANLQREFTVRTIDGGWEVKSRDAKDLRTPLVGLAAKDGVIQNVSFIWGPGVTPSLEEMFRQVAQALPADAQCGIHNITRPFEGGTVRTLVFTCARTTIDVRTGVWPQGNTASIAIRGE